ncbi:MAG: hypothetical protein JXR71_01995 [Bacteroidales bacterium]|nr:hypothetical protein [Bacteroidales bacterium]
MIKFTRLLFVFTTVVILLLTSCLKSTKPGIPESVRRTMEASGINQPELMRAMVRYSKPADSLKQKALYWLLANMHGNYSVSYRVEDTTGHKYIFSPQRYSDYARLKISWDSVERLVGPLSYHADSFLLDQQHITAAFLTGTIDTAFLAYRTFSWSRNYSFDLFCRWILPYRCANEKMEPFRSHFLKKYQPFLVKSDSLSVLEAALILNELVNTELGYKDSYNKEANVQSIQELEKNGYGNFYDLNIYKVKVLRSFGIAATMDYTPYLADTSYGYAWTTVILPDRSEFMLEFPQKVYNLQKPGRIAKVFRRTYEKDTTSLFAVKQTDQTTPPYLGHFYNSDITNPLNSKTVWMPYFRKTPYAYLAVFNDGNWHPVGWSAPKEALGTVFHQMGTDVVYLPVKQEKKKLYWLGPPFLLANDGSIRKFSPDFSREQKTMLTKTGPYQNLIPGVSYTLYLWNGNWSSLFSFTAKKSGVTVPLPTGGLYLLTNDDPLMRERIFSLSPQGHQIFH